MEQNPHEAPPNQMRTILLLTFSNVFMTIAWYGHPKHRGAALWKVILISWGMLSLSICFQVPANRIGSYEFFTAQLKTIQEIITLSIFPVFSVFYLGDEFKWNYGVGFWIHCCRCVFRVPQVVAVRHYGHSILFGGHTRTSCLRAKCKSGCESSLITNCSAMLLDSHSASAPCSGQGE